MYSSQVATSTINYCTEHRDTHPDSLERLISVYNGCYIPFQLCWAGLMMMSLCVKPYLRKRFRKELQCKENVLLNTTMKNVTLL